MRTPAAAVLYDRREENSGLPALLAEQGIPVQPATLPVGDYLVSDTICVERKANGDLGSSIRDGRLFEQAVRLKEAYPGGVLLVEGLPPGVFPPRWRGPVCKLVESGITVLQSTGPADSAEWIARLALRARRDPSRVGLPVAGRRPLAATPRAQAVAMLASVRGISPATATRVLAHFGTLAGLCAATPRELQAVAGIGPGRARNIHQVLHAS